MSTEGFANLFENVVEHSPIAAVFVPIKRSAEEHKAAGLDKLTTKLWDELNELNRAYAEKFGLPLVLSVRQNNKFNAILEGLRQRLPNTCELEIANGIGQVKQICKLRIEIIVESGNVFVCSK